jgi:hypothetical protein
MPTKGSNRLLGCLLGGVMGMLFTCCLGIAALFLLESPPTVPASQPPAEYEIEAIIEEDYINRAMLESVAGLPTPVPLVAGHLDIHPGGPADFAQQIELGPVRTVALRATPAGELEVILIEVRAGYVPVTTFVPSDLLAAVNQSINQQLTNRLGTTGVQLVGVASDETTLRFYLR